MAEQVPPSPKHVSSMPLTTGKLAKDRSDELRHLLDGFASQIDDINANMASLGSKSAAAMRFLTVSLAACQRAWAELTRDDVDLGGAVDREVVATLVTTTP